MAFISEPFAFKNLQLKNRIVMAPMCQYSVSTRDGVPNDWHFVHYVSRAVGGTGLIITEMTDVEPDGRITNYCAGLWNDEQKDAFARIIREVHKYGAKIGIQIAHAGRKAEDTPNPVGPSDLRANEKYRNPRPLATDEVKAMVEKFKSAAERAVAAGVDTIELHGAHGYLLHQFHSPNINTRKDEYGQDLSKFGREVVQAVKSVMPAGMPLLMRISAVEFMEGGYDLDYSIDLARSYHKAGVDIFHVSCGGAGPAIKRKPYVYPGYMVPFARAFKMAMPEVPVIAVGMLEEPKLAEATLAHGDADLVAVGRGMLRDPYWAVHAIREITGEALPPKQYERAY